MAATAAQPTQDGDRELGLVLTGGGARGAYQVGVLRWLARHYPDLRLPILTGVSAGAVNIAKLAAHHGTFRQAVEELDALWGDLTVEHVFDVDPSALMANALRWGRRLMSGGRRSTRHVRGFLDTEPLRQFLEEVLATVNGEITGIDYNLSRGTLQAVAIITTSYTTGQTVAWVKGRDVETWRRPQRRTEAVRSMTVDHIMASTALPIFFPAVRIGDQWYGDGGIRLAAPLSPALHLGADRILAISTRFGRSRAEAGRPAIDGYPPPAQVLGVLLNAMFLDLVDQDALRLQRLNALVRELPPERRHGMRELDLLVMRPSQDLGRLAANYELDLPRTFRFMIRGLGTRETKSPDVLAMLMFEPEYLQRLMDLGEDDAEARREDLEMFIEERGQPGTAST